MNSKKYRENLEVLSFEINRFIKSFCYLNRKSFKEKIGFYTNLSLNIIKVNSINIIKSIIIFKMVI